MSRFEVLRRLLRRGRGREESVGRVPDERERAESDDPDDNELAAQQDRLAGMLYRREALRAEAERVVDRRLDLRRDAAPWNAATFGTLTAASAASAVTLVLTGFTWWFLLPVGLGVLSLLQTVQAVRRLRGHDG
ncbi:hypothetical protein [Streptomyces sp. NPDC048603]|uniref:hypothetical protein n=1 Tax=Streptomyces sp. NPDC048603 TaxID=3365577 RepID=UPI00371C6B4E